jgi:hypothetical protein
VEFDVVAFTDANGDMLDDTTEERPEGYMPPPTTWDPVDLEGKTDILSIMRRLKETFQGIEVGVSTIVSMMSVIFGWLPVEFLALIIILGLIIVLTTILKILRG